MSSFNSTPCRLNLEYVVIIKKKSSRQMKIENTQTTKYDLTESVGA